MVDHELFVGEIPIGTPLIDLRGHQCILAFGHAQLNGVRWERCEHESAAVVAVSCTACGQGGLMPVCKQHAAQLSRYAQEQVPGECPKCHSLNMTTAEPVEFPTVSSAPDAVSGVAKSEEENFWEMDW